MKRLSKLNRIFFLLLYYGFFRYMPQSNTPLIGKFSKYLRYMCVKRMFAACGNNINVERMAYFGSGRNIKIGANSGIGVACTVPSDIQIGENVMMGPGVHVFSANHKFDRIDIPMCLQGHSPRKMTVIEDDVWIGRQVMIMPGRRIRTGTIVAAGSVVSKDFPDYSIVGGNPATVIKNRKYPA